MKIENKWKNMTQCSAHGCKNTGVHVFPKDPKRRKLWEKALRRKDWKATNASKLCSSHFKPEDYYGASAYTGNEPLAKFLKRNVVPSVFLFSKPETPLSRERKILENRSKRKLLPSSKTQSTFNHAENIDAIKESSVDRIVHLSMNEMNTTNEQGTQVNFEHAYGCIKRFMNDDEAISFYTGFKSYKIFNFVYLTLSPMTDKIQYYGSKVKNLSMEDQFFLTMIKLRQDKCNFELSRFFNVSQITVSNVFITFINFMHQLWSKLNIWPDKDLVQYFAPESIKKYSNVMIDGNEIKVEKSQNPVSQHASAYGGSVSDRQTVEHSDIIQKCDSGDSILADRGFNIQDLFAEKKPVNMPTFLKGESQIQGLTVSDDYKLASKRVHMEHIIWLTKTYKILNNDLHHSYIPVASKIFFVCFMCCHFRETIMK